MGKQIWKPGNSIYPLPAVMVSCGRVEDKNANIITASWTGSINTNPPKAYVSIRKERFSYDLIKKYGDFVINITTKDLVEATDFCGVRSGRDYNKFKKCNLTPLKSQVVGCPSIDESPINVECKVFDVIELGSHDMFLADIVSVTVDDKYFDENNKFKLNDAKPICYSHGGYYTIEEFLGGFGFSVKKEKKKNAKNKKNTTEI